VNTHRANLISFVSGIGWISAAAITRRGGRLVSASTLIAADTSSNASSEIPFFAAQFPNGRQGAGIERRFEEGKMCRTGETRGLLFSDFLFVELKCARNALLCPFRSLFSD
jgi:hypothetical protein